MEHNRFSSERLTWSSTISNGHEELIKTTLPAQKVIYTEQNESEDPFLTVLDYSGIDAIAVTGLKEAHALSLRVTNYNAPQVTIRSSEVDAWNEVTNHLRPSHHVQFVQSEGHTRYVIIVDLTEFRKLNDSYEYLYKINSKKGNGHFYAFTQEALELPCVRVWEL